MHGAVNFAVNFSVNFRSEFYPIGMTHILGADMKNPRTQKWTPDSKFTAEFTALWVSSFGANMDGKFGSTLALLDAAFLRTSCNLKCEGLLRATGTEDQH